MGQQAAYLAWIYHFSDFAVHAHDSHLERRWRARLSVPAVSDCAHTENKSQSPSAIMTISINDIAVEIGQWPTKRLRRFASYCGSVRFIAG